LVRSAQAKNPGRILLVDLEDHPATPGTVCGDSAVVDVSAVVAPAAGGHVAAPEG